MSELRPTEGARYLLERVPGDADRDDGGDGARATYRATIFTPDAEYTATAVLCDDGSVELPPTGAPAELDATLAMLARLTARGAPHRRDEGLIVWPPRILRWRGPGRG